MWPLKVDPLCKRVPQGLYFDRALSVRDILGNTNGQSTNTMILEYVGRSSSQVWVCMTPDNISLMLDVWVGGSD